MLFPQHFLHENHEMGRIADIVKVLQVCLKVIRLFSYARQEQELKESVSKLQTSNQLM